MPAEVDESTIVGEVLNHAAEHPRPSSRASRVSDLRSVKCSSSTTLAGQNDIAALLVDLDDPHLEVLAPHAVEVSNWTHIDLRAGKERADTDVHGEAAFDALDDTTFHDRFCSGRPLR